MLCLTHEPFDLYSSPPRLGIGDGLNVIVPEGKGMLRDRWDIAADELFEELRSLEDNGRFLQYKWCDDDTTVLIRIHEGLRPATHVLTHPKLIRFLRRSLRILFGCEPVVYVKGEEICSRPHDYAAPMDGWKGPFDIDTGYCLTHQP